MLKSVFQATLKDTRLSVREQKRVTLWISFLKSAHELFLNNFARVKAIRRVWILNNSRVFLSTIEATARMAREVEEAFEGMQPAKKAVGQLGGGRYSRVPKEEDPTEQDSFTLKIDTCIIDEAGSVLESAVPVLLFWKPSNLVLVTEEIAGPKNHARSLLERCVDAGMEPWFLPTQYRMHPRLSALVSRLFYNDRLKSAPPAHLPKPHPQPCMWAQSGWHGDEIEHAGGGFSNPEEVLVVAEHAERVVSSELYPLTYVITFYNKQKQALLQQFQAVPVLAFALEAGILLILSVDACQGSEADCVIISPVRTEVKALTDDQEEEKKQKSLTSLLNKLALDNFDKLAEEIVKAEFEMDTAAMRVMKDMKKTGETSEAEFEMGTAAMRAVKDRKKSGWTSEAKGDEEEEKIESDFKPAAKSLTQST
eukprot:gene21645-28657_t